MSRKHLKLLLCERLPEIRILSIELREMHSWGRSTQTSHDLTGHGIGVVIRKRHRILEREHTRDREIGR
jgi:hypothetical protein